MTDYKGPQILTAKMPWGETIKLRVDLAQASALIEQWDDDIEDWNSTPFQTADAAHDKRKAVRLMLEWFGSDYYANPDDDRDDDEQLEEIMDKIVIRVENEDE